MLFAIFPPDKTDVALPTSLPTSVLWTLEIEAANGGAAERALSSLLAEEVSMGLAYGWMVGIIGLAAPSLSVPAARQGLSRQAEGRCGVRPDDQEWSIAARRPASLSCADGDAPL